MMHTATDEEARGQAALYALGALDTEEARAFEEHLGAGCAACAAGVEEFGAAVASLAEAAPPAEPPAGVRARLLARTKEDGRGRGESPGAGFFILRAGEGEWAETEDEGVSYKLLFADRARGTVTTLVRLRPGARIPPHRHLGVEQCLVLEGDLRSGPYTMGAGDFNCSLPDSIHDELTTDGGALLLLVSPASYERITPRS
jgi:anti-sigma factor ChrR (cupin superfamily)